jgi:hypothetical protein
MSEFALLPMTDVEMAPAPTPLPPQPIRPTFWNFWSGRLVILLVSIGFAAFLLHQAVEHGRARYLTCEAPTTLFWANAVPMCLEPEQRLLVWLSRERESSHMICSIKLNDCTGVLPRGSPLPGVFVCPVDSNTDEKRYTCSFSDTSHSVAPQPADVQLAWVSGSCASLMLVSALFLALASAYRWRVLCRTAV